MITGKALDREKEFEEQKDIKLFMGIFTLGKIFRQMFTLQNTFKSGKQKTHQTSNPPNSSNFSNFSNLSNSSNSSNSSCFLLSFCRTGNMSCRTI